MTRTITSLCLALFALSGACGGVAAGQASPEPAPSVALSAVALYDAAYDRWKALPKSAFATYLTHVEVTRKNRTQRRLDRIAYRRSDNICLTVGVPLDARDRPDAPTVTDRCLAPDYSFTFVPQRAPGHGGPLPVQMATPAPEESRDASAATIGHVVVRTRAYNVVFAGDESVRGTLAAHLVLQPVVQPAKHILRDIWIDRVSNGVVRLHGVAPLAASLATVDFIAEYDVGPQSQTLALVRGFAKAQFLLFKLGADFAFEQTDVAYPPSLPDWYFEKNGYATHAAATRATATPTARP